MCREALKQARADLASARRREQELRRALEQKEKRLADIEASTEDTRKKVCGDSASCPTIRVACLSALSRAQCSC